MGAAVARVLVKTSAPTSLTRKRSEVQIHERPPAGRLQPSPRVTHAKGLGDGALLRSRPMLTRVRFVRSVIGTAVVCATIVMVVPSAVAARPPKLPWDGPGIRTKPGRLIVTFEAGTSLAQRRRTHSDVGARLADQSRRTRVDVVELPPGVSALAAIRRYQADPRVLSAEPDRFAVPTVIPDDPHFPKQWALNNTGQLHRITGSNN